MDRDSKDWDEISAAFDALVDLPSAQRTDRLKSLAPEIAAEVASLLEANSVSGVLDNISSSPHPDATLSDYSSLGIGSFIGGFCIDRLIGRGGMGEVYEAHRIDASFSQKVALKLLRPEAIGHAASFDRERQILASLEHPGIARLIDGGIAPDGRPYMAMEFVNGHPITDWCRDNRAGLVKRLRLIQEVCEAVGYAHARLLIHRDLKPANILVDEQGRVRLLDFGVARLMDETLSTGAVTQALGTPEYAAPEQLRNETSTVATDIYAIGVLAFELLTGASPWRGTGLGLHSIITRALEDDPPKPSDIASKTNGPVAAIKLKGDLDAVIQKAMRHEPTGRYRSASELGDDISRHLRLEPVIALAGSARYRITRFIRRYRIAVGAASVAVLALVVGAGGIAFQARQTAIERDVATAEARRSEAIVRMLTVMFRESATSGRGEQASVKQMLDQTADRVIGSIDTSAQSATLIATLFDLYVNLEDSAAADALVVKARQKGIGALDPVANAQLAMRQATSAAALGRTAEMDPLLNIAEATFKTNPERFRVELLELSLARAQWLRRTGKLDDAIALLQSILPVADQVYAENHRDLLTLYNNLLVYILEANRTNDMLPIFDRVDAVLARTGQRDSMQGLTITQLKGMRLLRTDQAALAEQIFLAVSDKRRALFGRSAGLAVDLLQLSRARMAQGKFAGARDVLLEARPMASEKLSPVAPPTLFMGVGLVEALAETGDFSGAIGVLDEITPIITKLPKPSPVSGLLERSKAALYLAQGRLDDAKVAAKTAEAILSNLGTAGAPYLKAMPTLIARIDAAANVKASQ